MDKDKGISIIVDTGLETPVINLTTFVLKKVASGSESFKFIKYQYQNRTINKVTILSTLQSFYFAQIKNLLIISIDKALVEKNIDNFLLKKNILDNENYLQVRSQIGPKNLIRVFFNIKSFLDDIKSSDIKLYQNLQTLSILSIAGAGLNIRDNSLVIDSFFSAKMDDKILTKLFLTNPKRINSLHYLPGDTISSMTLTFDNFKDLLEYYKKILIDTGQNEVVEQFDSNQKQIEKVMNSSMDEILFSWLNNEITIASVSVFNAPLILLSVKDPKKVDTIISKLQEKDILSEFSFEKYKGKKISQIKPSSFFKLLFEIISPDLELPYYTFYEDYIILSRDKQEIKSVIDAIEKDDVLINKENVKNLYSGIKKGNIICYWNLSNDNINLLKNNNFFSSIIRSYNFGMLGMEFLNSGIKGKVMISGQKSTDVKTIEGWPIQFNSTIWYSPVFYETDKAEVDKILISTEEGKIYLYDIFGEKVSNWPILADKKLLTRPFFIKSNNQGTCFGVISSSGKIYVWNKDGFLLAKFPLSIEGSCNTTPLIQDLNNNGKDDIIIANDKGKIFAFNLEGNLLSGFPVQLPVNTSVNLQLFDLYNDHHSEILCSSLSSDGDIFFINDKGLLINDKTWSTGSINIIPPVVSEINLNEKAVILIKKDGILYVWKRNGTFVKGFPLDLGDKFANEPVITDLYHNSHKEIILLSKKGILYILSSTGKLLKQLNLNCTPIENEKIIVRDINHDGNDEFIIPCTDNTIHFFNEVGKMMFKIKGSTSPDIKDIDKDGRFEITTAADDGNVFLYKLPE